MPHPHFSTMALHIFIEGSVHILIVNKDINGLLIHL